MVSEPYSEGGTKNILVLVIVLSGNKANYSLSLARKEIPLANFLRVFGGLAV
jgi:hypothetical protein